MLKSTTIMARSISQDSRHEYPNSDTKLERTHLSDAQYIEQLLFENKELKALVDRQKKIIEKLNNQLKSSNGNKLTLDLINNRTPPLSQNHHLITLNQNLNQSLSLNFRHQQPLKFVLNACQLHCLQL